jgi:tropomodulin
MASTKTIEKAQKDDDFDVDDLLTQLSAEELEMLSKEVDPDVRKFVLYFFSPDT